MALAYVLTMQHLLTWANAIRKKQKQKICCHLVETQNFVPSKQKDDIQTEAKEEKERRFAMTTTTTTQSEEEGRSKRRLHVAMLPWFAYGHMTPFLHLANKLAERGHRTTLLLPHDPLLRLSPSNLHPDLITLLPISLPDSSAHTASDLPISSTALLATALDSALPQLDSALRSARPPVDLVLYDMACWVPHVAAPLGIKSVCYNVVCAAAIAIALVPARKVRWPDGRPVAETDLAEPPPGYPSSSVVLRTHEAKALSFITQEYGSGMTFYERITMAMKDCDAISIRTCREIEGPFCDYIQSQYQKPVILTGPILPDPTADALLEPQWAEWLSGFEAGSIVFCTFGSQFVLEKEQLQELVLGLEMTGRPFFVALKPPFGAGTVEAALPDGFKERVGKRGVVHGDWVQQPLILSHPSVGCFVTHCGFGSMWEALMSECQIVAVPQLGDQILNARLVAGELKAAVEAERGEDGRFTKEGVCGAVKSMMDEGSEVGKTVRRNHAKAREALVGKGLMSHYIDDFVQNLQGLLS